MEEVEIFDTTLRDGEQSPGIVLRPAEKLEIAQALASLGVQTIEAGFPIASPGDLEAVQLLSREVRGPRICALARAENQDILAAWEGVRDAERPRIHTFLSTSDIHIEHQMGVSKKDILGLTRAAVSQARELCSDVQFSPMDATRSDLEFVAEVVSVALEEGASTINIPDTVGYTTPDEYKSFLRRLQDMVPSLKGATLSVHTHQDLGLAVANAYAGVQAGARQVECAVNGIGERAGNCSLEEIVMLLETRSDEHGMSLNLDTRELIRVSRLVARYTGYPVPANKAIVGANAFAHESGIHQDGVLKERSTYEIMNPADVGLESNTLVLGKHSGRHAFKNELEQMGYKLSGDEVNRAFRRFKEIADSKQGITQLDLEALLSDSQRDNGDIELVFFEAETGSSRDPHAEVILKIDDKERYGEGRGDGPIDSVFQAIKSALGIEPELQSFQIGALSKGQDALGEAFVTLRYEDKQASAQAVDTDIVAAAALAYVRAAGKLGDIL